MKRYKKLNRKKTNLAAAYAMERVAEPAPAFALTTSVPASWILSVKVLRTSGANSTDGVHCEMSGMMVTPAWPPTTGHDTSALKEN